jgi:hypothetical protein
VGGGDHADVEALAPGRAERRDLARLEQAEELGLQEERQVADLVEEQGAAVRLGEGAGRSATAPVKALSVAEEVGLDERLGRRAAVDTTNGPLLRALCWWTARGQLLAGAARR